MWEKYQITDTILCIINWIFQQRGVANQLIVVPHASALFLSYHTDQLLEWLQWNINKLCTEFEMAYSLQLRTVVH